MLISSKKIKNFAILTISFIALIATIVGLNNLFNPSQNGIQTANAQANSATCTTILNEFRRLVRGNDISKIITQAQSLKNQNCRVSGNDARDYGLALADIELRQNGRLINNYMNSNPSNFITRGGSAQKTIALVNQYAKEGDFGSVFSLLEMYNGNRRTRTQPTREERILMRDLELMWGWGYQDDVRWEYFKLWQNRIYGSIDRL